MKLLLIDGNYYAYRSFFAIRNLSNSRGEPTNAIYGFVKTVRRMLSDLRPDLAAVVWDDGLPERRTQLQPEYKQHRPAMPEQLVPQIDYIQKFAPLLGLAGVQARNTEADDLMASYTCAAVNAGLEVVLATNDKDLFQLVDERVKIYTTNKADLVAPKDLYALLDAGCVQKRWGVPGNKIGDVLSLVGDSVDNIPGVPGLGPKGAAALINEFGSLDALLDRVENVKSERTRASLQAARHQILQNREMVKLDTELPLPMPLEEMRIIPKYPELLKAVEECEFKSLLQELVAESRRSVPVQSELF